MLVWIAAVVVGLVLLVWGADRFVMGASATASNLGVSPLIIGLTVVGIGTSAPEMLVSATAALQGNAGVSVGNAVGSNIANIGLVLGATALFAPLSVHSLTLKREFPLMFLVIALAAALLYDGRLGLVDGVVLMIALVGLLVLMVWRARHTRRDPLIDEFAKEIPSTMSTGTATLWVLIGLAVLLVGSKSIVWGAVNVARSLDVSDLVIGLTIVAVGTSLPELAASAMSSLKGEPDIALGNVIGSNMFNLLPVLALPGIIAPGPVDPEVLSRDYPLMVVLSIALFIMAYGLRGPGRIQRWEGALLLLAFIGYQSWLYLSMT